MERVDIFVSGGGIAGLTAAAVFAARGWSVALADPAPPESADVDTRSTAFLQPARRLFDAAGIWDALAPSSAPLDILRVIDTAGWPPVETARRDFAATDVGEVTFGWNLPNAVTRPALVAALRRQGGVRLHLGAGFRALVMRDREAVVTLSDGTRIGAALVVAADGRASPVRAAVGIDVALTRYGQRALAFAVTHPEPHGNVSTEIYNRGGAFTLVPMPDRDGVPASAVVWMEDAPRAERLAALPPEDLATEATTRSGAVLGSLSLAGPVRDWPVVTQTARRMTEPRVALVAEAAHVLPPIGAQGLNTSLADIAALAEAMSLGDDPGDAAVLATYERTRATDIRQRAAAIDLFNRVCRSGAPAIQAARSAGLRALHDLAPARRAVMRAGLGG
jgi:2-octaprenyl-6-methoxyphenol hydroxylase